MFFAKLKIRTFVIICVIPALGEKNPNLDEPEPKQQIPKRYLKSIVVELIS